MMLGGHQPSDAGVKLEGYHQEAGGDQPYMAAINSYPSIFRETPYHPMFSSFAPTAAATDPYSAALMGPSPSYDSYSNMGYGYISPYYRYMRQQPVKQEMTCEWMDRDTRKLCKKVYYTMNEMVNHLTVDHVGGPEVTDNACHWAGCPREQRSFKAKYKLVNHIRSL